MTNYLVKDIKNKFLFFYITSITLIFFITMLFYCRGNFASPLDDAYIYFQYAKNLSQGHFFEYVKGEGYSSGATSFIYVFFLLPFVFFLKGESIVLATYILGFLCLFITGIFLYKTIFLLLKDEKFALFGLLLFLTNGNFLWGFFSGMEICIVTTCLIISFYYILYSKDKIKTIFFLSLLSLSRPEAYLLVIVLFLIKFINWILNKKEEFLSYIIPVLIGFTYFLLNKIFTDDFMPNTMRAKSNFSLYYFDYTEMLKHGFNFYISFIMDIFNGDKEHYFLHNSFFIFLLGLLSNILEEIKNRKIGIYCISFCWFFLGSLSTMFSSFALVHNFRYTMPFMIIFIIFFVNGIKFIVNKLNIPKNNIIIFSFLSLFIFFNLFTILANILNFGRDTNAIYSQSIKAGKWLKENIKEGKVAINDVGAIQYFYDGKIYDLVGLVTNKQAINFRNGLPGVFEALERIRPDYFMVHIGWFNFEPYTVFLRPKIIEFTIPKEPPYYVIGAPEVCYKTDFSLFNSADEMLEDFTENGKFVLKDKIDICDIVSEKEHNYKIWVKWRGEYPGTELYEEYYKNTKKKIIDGGRITSGGEKFIIKNLIPKIDTKIVIRTYNNPTNILDVWIDKKFIGKWQLNENKGFNEYEFFINGDFIEKEKETIKLEVKSKNRYNSFYYFILQKQI